MTSFAQNGLLLDVQHVTMRFGGITAVNDLSMRIPTGSITGLIGPNGAGILKQALHPRVVQILSPVRQSLHKAAHVRALERSGQIHADVHIGDRMLRPLRAIPHQQRQLQPFDPYPVDGQRHRSRTVLYVFHSFPLSYSLITKNVIPASCRGSFLSGHPHL